MVETEPIRAQFGEVAAGLLTYEFHPIPDDELTTGQKQALDSARGWMEQIISESVLGPEIDVAVSLHEGTDETCDSVRLSFGAGDQLGGRHVEISQSLYLILVALRPQNETDEPGPELRKLAQGLAEELFPDGRRVDLVLTRKEGEFSIGRQAQNRDIPVEQQDWLDALWWWSDGKTVCFFFPKLTGGLQSTRVSPDFEPNHEWFAKYEQKRTK